MQGFHSELFTSLLFEGVCVCVYVLEVFVQSWWWANLLCMYIVATHSTPSPPSPPPLPSPPPPLPSPLPSIACNLSRRHSTDGVCLTSLRSSPSHLLVGTNTGVILTVPLPYIEPSLEPHPLLHPPTPTSLHYGHDDAVQFLSVVQREGTPLVITGGSGHKCFSMTTAQNAPDTANCLLMWRVNQQH